jgi:hypothetical protein
VDQKGVVVGAAEGAVVDGAKSDGAEDAALGVAE